VKYRPFGKSGFDVSEIGFGAWGIGGNHEGSSAYGATDDGESRASLRLAFKMGINFYDTSDFYGYGHSETLLAEVFSSLRERIILSTKAGFLDATRQDFSPRHLRQAFQGSLRRLKTDYVDVFFLHSPDLQVLRREPAILELMREWRKHGLVRCWGISTRTPQDALSAIHDFGAECIQVNFNLTDLRAVEIGLWELCAKEEVGVVVRTPLAFGFLTGTVKAGDAFPSDDHRRRFSAEQQERWQRGIDVYRGILQGEGTATPAQNALRFCLAFAAVSTVIPGMLTEDHVRENASSSDLPVLSPEGKAACLQAGREHGFASNSFS
jgi:aryl-alcohol dehydrogenase-like predicted oxidoreductase